MAEDFEAGVRFVATDEGVSATTEKMGTHFERTTDKMRQTIKQTGYLKLALTRIATYTAIFTFFGVLTKLIGEAISLQTRLAEVSTLVDMRNKEMAASFRVVTRDLLQLSPYLGKATDLTKGLYEIMSAGVTKPVEAFKLLVVSAKYAKAGITDLATAASSLTAIMKAYGYTADEMRGKSDMLFASVMEGKYHAEELNQAIGKVLPTAAAMGVHIDEISAALAVMTQRGLDVTEAATALNRMMLAFMRPIDKAKKEFQKLGWAWGRNAFEGIGLLGVLRRLVEASARYGDILPKIFRRQRALRGAFVLAGEGFKDYVRLLQKIRDATEDGGEVSRGYGKMIGTVAEEVKAAGAKMLKVMYELWEGKGFKWLSGFIRLASSFIAVLMRSSVVILAAIPIVWRLAKAYKVSSAAQLTNITFAKAYVNVLKSMTIAEIKHTATLSASNKALMIRHKYFMLMRGGVIAGVIAYAAIKFALDMWIASSDRAIATMHRESKAMKALRDELNLYVAAAKSAGEATGNVAKELRALGKADVLAALRKSFNVVGMYGDIVKALVEEFRVVNRGMLKDVTAFIEALRAGETDMTEFNYILEALARNWGYSTKRIKEWMDAQRTNLAIMEKSIEAMRFLSRLQRDWNKIVESSSQHVRGLARVLSKEELEDSIKLLGELMELTPEDPKWVLVQAYLTSLGLSLEKLTEKEIPKYIKRLEEALAVQPEVFREMKYEEFMREYLVIFEKMHPPLQALETSVEALADTWKTKWVEAYGDSAEVMKLFVKEHRTQLELIKNNLERLGDFENKVLLENFIKLLDTKLTAQEKYAKKALALHKTLISDFTRIDTNMEMMRNELRGEEWDDIVEQTKKIIKLEKVKLDKWVALEMQAESDMFAIWEEYTDKLLKLNEMLNLALGVGNLRRIEDLAKSTKSEIDMTSWSEFEKQARYNQTFRMYFELMSEMGITNKAELAAGLKVWKKTFGSIDTLSRSLFRKLTRDFGRFFSNIIVDLKNLNKNFGSFVKSILTLIGQMVAEMLLTWAKGLITMKLAFAAFIKSLKVMMKFFAVAFMAWVVAGIVKHILTVFGILRQKVDAEMQAILDKMEEVRRKGGEIAETISKEQLQAPTDKRVGGDGGKEVSRWVDEYAEALEELIKWLEIMERQTEFSRKYLEMFSDAWEELLDAMEEAGLEGSAAILELIKRTQELGIEVKVLDEYCRKWLDTAVEGLNAMVWAAGNTAEELQRLSNIAITIVNSMIAAGMSWIEIFAAIGESLLILKLRMDALGISGGEAIDALLDIALIYRLNKDLFDAKEGNLMVLDALGHSASFFGEKGAKAFADVAAQAYEYYQRLLDAGLTQEQALSVMAPTLRRLQYWAEEYGLVLDEDILKMIEMADEYGVLGEDAKSMTEILTEGFEGVIEAIRDLIEILTGSRGLTDALDTVGKHFPKFPSNGGRGGRGAQFGIPNLGQNALIYAHRGESILPPALSEALRQFFGGGAQPISVEEGGKGMQVAIISIDGRQFYKAIVPYIKEGKKYGDFETNAEEVY